MTRVLDRVAGRAGEDHVDAFLEPEFGLGRPVVGIIGVGQHGDAAALTAQRVHAGARWNIGADQARCRDVGRAVRARRSSNRVRWRTALGAIVAPPALATTNCDGPRCGPCPWFTAVAKVDQNSGTSAGDVVVHLRLQARQRDGQSPGVRPSIPSISVSTT